jgi:hypothetical protein
MSEKPKPVVAFKMAVDLQESIASVMRSHGLHGMISIKNEHGMGSISFVGKPNADDIEVEISIRRPVLITPKENTDAED